MQSIFDDCPVGQSIALFTLEWLSEWMSGCLSEWVSERASERVREWLSEWVSEKKKKKKLREHASDFHVIIRVSKNEAEIKRLLLTTSLVTKRAGIVP